nr:protein SIEVE ELEMENT OCCLUSION B-like [Ipomoea batatas]
MATQPLSLSRTMISKLQITHVDEKIIIEQVKDTHNPNGGIDVDANSLLKLLEGIFTLNTDSKSAEDNSEKEDETSNENPESSDEDNSENEDEFSNEDSESDEDNPENEDETSNENPQSSDEDNSENGDEFSNEDSESDEDNPENEDESSNDDSKRDEDDPEEEGSDEHGKPETVHREARQDRLQLQEHIHKEISFVVLQLSFMVTFTCVSYDDCHSTAIYLLSLLSKYMWHAKGVMLLACFAIIRGKSKITSQSCHRKGLSYNMAFLRKSVNSLLSTENEIFLNDSIKSMFDLTELMVELRHSSSIFLANYWIARSVVAYAHLLTLDLE